jgi:hypothetical protein
MQAQPSPPKDNFQASMCGFLMNIEEGNPRGVDRIDFVRLFDGERDDGL